MTETTLSDDELTVLLIAAEDQSMMPIGRWRAPVESLLARGYLRSLDHFNHVITPEGRKAIEGRAAEDVLTMEQAYRQTYRDVADAQAEARRAVEEAAQALVRAAKVSVGATGDRLDTAVLNWNGELLRRALKLVRS